MKTGFKTFLLVTLGTALLQFGCAHQERAAQAPAVAEKTVRVVDEKPAPAAGEKPAPAVAEKQPAFTNLEDKVGYAMGTSVGNYLKRSHFDVNLDELMNGIKDALAGRELKMSDQQGREAIMAYQQQKQRELAEKNTKAGDAFLAQNKMKDGVKTLAVTLADGKTVEMQYQVITNGTGAIPRSNDVVTVNFRGMTIDGKEFDNSAKRGPTRLILDRFLRGWTEALELMTVGSKWEIYLPASLAYGEHGTMGVDPGSAVIFELELVSAEPQTPPKPVTSDIIKVPSAEEMKAGKQVEVIKAEDAEKAAAAAQTNQTNANKN